LNGKKGIRYQVIGIMKLVIRRSSIGYKPQATNFDLSAFNLNIVISHEVPERSEWDQLKTLTLP
jgi:hypothetical protein